MNALRNMNVENELNQSDNEDDEPSDEDADPQEDAVEVESDESADEDEQEDNENLDVWRLVIPGDDDYQRGGSPCVFNGVSGTNSRVRPERTADDSETIVNYGDIFIPSDLIDMLVNFTNVRAGLSGDEKWKPTNRDEMKKFIQYVLHF